MNKANRNADERADRPTDSLAGRIISAADFADVTADPRNGDGRQRNISQLPSFHKQAWQHGYQQGLRHAMSELRTTLAGLRLCREDLDTWVSQLVFAVLRKVLGHHDAAAIVSLIARRAIDDCAQGITSIAVHVHPDAADTMKEEAANLTSDDLRIDVVSDASLQVTGCELHTAFGIVDASLNTQLDALQHAILANNAELADG